MKSGWWIWTSTVILLALIGPEAEAGSTPRDLSGGAMQRHDSRMVSSTVSSTPGYFSSTARDSSGGGMQRPDSRVTASAMRSAPRDFCGDALPRGDSPVGAAPVVSLPLSIGGTHSLYILY